MFLMLHKYAFSSLIQDPYFLLDINNRGLKSTELYKLILIIKCLNKDTSDGPITIKHSRELLNYL